MTPLFLLVLGSWLAACDRSPPPPTVTSPPPGATDTGGADTADLPTADTGATSTPMPRGCVVDEQDLPTSFQHLWAAPTGELFATSYREVAVRSVDGAWSFDADAPPHVLRLHGYDPDNVWVVTDTGVFRRDPGSGWVDMAFPGDAPRVEALHVTATTTTLVEAAVSSGYGPTQLTVHIYNGATWAPAFEVDYDDTLRDVGVLPDGSLVGVDPSADEVMVYRAGAWSTVPSDPTIVGDTLHVAADGTLLVVGTTPGVGDVHGLEPLATGRPNARLDEGWAGAPDDVWLLGTDEGEPVLLHHDGAATREVPLPPVDGPLRHLAAGAGQAWLTVDEPAVRSVLAGDPAGLQLDRADPLPGGHTLLIVDDVDGSVYGFGFDGASTFDGTSWVPALQGLPSVSHSPRVVASAGRVVAGQEDTLYEWTAGEVSTHTLEAGANVRKMVGAGGALFAVGEYREYEGPALGPGLWADDGGGWHPIDLSSLPDSTYLAGAWADGPDSLWLGLSIGPAGALAHYDGTAVHIVEELPTAPSAIRRQHDGQLWMALYEGPTGVDGLHIYDGTDVLPVAGGPTGAITAHLFPDGSLLVSSSEFLQNGLHLRSVDGAWSQLLTDDFPMPLAGWQGDAWASRDWGSVAWRRTCP